LGQELSPVLLPVIPQCRSREARRWLVDTDQRHAYAPRRQAFPADGTDLEAWLLACALRAHPAVELPFTDLLRLPELFPFRFTLTLDHLRQYPRFAVQRQGAGWDMVRLILSDREDSQTQNAGRRTLDVGLWT
jgi:hypothetical protein